MQKVLCTTLLIEKSPQALPLGVACIASAIKNDDRTKKFYNVELCDFCKESPEIKKILSGAEIGAEKNAGEMQTGSYIAEQLAKKVRKLCFLAFTCGIMLPWKMPPAASKK